MAFPRNLDGESGFSPDGSHQVAFNAGDLETLDIDGASRNFHPDAQGSRAQASQPSNRLSALSVTRSGMSTQRLSAPLQASGNPNIRSSLSSEGPQARRSRMQQQQRHMTASFLELHQFHDVKTPRSSPLRIGKTLVRGVCPVHLAAYLGDATALLLLLDAGADPEQLTEDRKDAEDVALLARKGSSHNKFLRVLQAAKARVLEIQSDYCASEAPRRCRCRDGVCYECDQLLVASF
ncbi:unnamed protein product [Durusdinium trenchii]|uniref:Uncharacterized protein n=2 Tax=Durusdinium trenchii TaxID=1381693 RepID=A0ABP0M1S0_9DINO